MVSASLSPTENITFEGFYQYDWEEVKIDPPGSYWSTNDFVGDGGDKVMLGWGAIDDQGNLSADLTFNGVPRKETNYADDDGQFGVAMRVYAPALNDTEFGFYYINYHSRLPVISAWTGDAAGLGQAQSMQTAVAPAVLGAYAASGGTATLNQLVAAGMGPEQPRRRRAQSPKGLSLQAATLPTPISPVPSVPQHWTPLPRPLVIRSNIRKTSSSSV